MRVGRVWILRTGGLAALLATAAVLTAPPARADEPLGRYISSEGLAVYGEFDGLDAHRAAWEKTAAHKVLAETKTGAMLRSIIGQLLGMAGEMPQANGPSVLETETMLKHVVRKGLALGVRVPPRAEGEGRGGKPAAAVVLRGAGGGEAGGVFLGYLGRLSERSGKSKQVDGPGGRKATAVGEEWGYWTEGEDLVLVFGDVKRAAMGVIEAVEGKAKNAAGLREEPANLPKGFEEAARGFIDVAALGPMPPQAVELGLDGLKRIDFHWGFENEAIVNVAHVRAPAPRKGLLALIDQPTFDAGSMIPLPAGLTDYAVLSLDGSRIVDTLAGIPQARPDVEKALAQFREMAGLELKKDVLDTFGPQWAFYIQPQKIDAPSNPLGGVTSWILNPPKVSAVVQVRDRDALKRNLERLAAFANQQIARQKPGDEPRIQVQPLKEGDGFVLDIPPAVAPLPAGVRPALRIGDKLAAIGISPEVAADAINPRQDRRWRAEIETLGDKLLLVQQNDPRNSLPELIANVPFFLGLLAQSAKEPSAPPFAKALARLKIDPEQVPDPESIRKLLFPNRTAVSLNDDGLTIVSRESVPGISASPATAGIMVGLMLPAVQAAREAARRAQCMNNLKQMALAMHIVHDAKGHFPPAAIRSDDGKPLLSWRVAILPYIEQEPLYRQFHLDEPWDSPHNKALIASMPAIYACPSAPRGREQGQTPYQVIVGKGALFESPEGVKLQEVIDGTSNTLMIVETKEFIPWTQPDDVEFDPENPLAALGSFHPGGFNAAFADGSVRFIKTTIAAQVLKALITRNGGEVISAGQY